MERARELRCSLRHAGRDAEADILEALLGDHEAAIAVLQSIEEKLDNAVQEFEGCTQTALTLDEAWDEAVVRGADQLCLELRNSSGRRVDCTWPKVAEPASLKSIV